MDLSADDLAGIVDVLGPVTRGELRQACTELAFKRGADTEPEAFDPVIEDALDGYHLVVVPDHDADADEPLLAVGPVAFPSLPEGAADLPHIMDHPGRTLDRATVASAAEERFREEAARAVTAGDDERVATLLDVSYDLESWGPVELRAARERLDDG